VWGVLCLHLMGTMAVSSYPRACGERITRVIAGHLVFGRGPGGNPGFVIFEVPGQLQGTRPPCGWPGTTTQTAQLETS